MIAWILYPLTALLLVEYVMYAFAPQHLARLAYLPLRGVGHLSGTLPHRLGEAGYREPARLTWEAEDLASTAQSIDHSDTCAGVMSDGTAWVRRKIVVFGVQRAYAIVRLTLEVHDHVVSVRGRHAPMPLSAPITVPVVILAFTVYGTMPLALGLVALLVMTVVAVVTQFFALNAMAQTIDEAATALLQSALARANAQVSNG
jgi:hypothetical protein